MTRRFSLVRKRPEPWSGLLGLRGDVIHVLDEASAPLVGSAATAARVGA